MRMSRNGGAGQGRRALRYDVDVGCCCCRCRCYAMAAIVDDDGWLNVRFEVEEEGRLVRQGP